MKCNFVNSSVLSTSTQCRLDSKYTSFVHNQAWLAYPSKNASVPLSDIIIPLPITKILKGELDEPHTLINISDQEAASGKLYIIQEVTEIGSDKTVLSDCDLMISKLGMSRGYIS